MACSMNARAMGPSHIQPMSEGCRYRGASTGDGDAPSPETEAVAASDVATESVEAQSDAERGYRSVPIAADNAQVREDASTPIQARAERSRALQLRRAPGGTEPCTR